VKVVTTLNASLRSVFDALLRAARRRGDEVRSRSSGRTLSFEIGDGEWLRPFVGTHRVQRIPKGASARHTSTATIALVDGDSRGAITLAEDDIEERFDRGSGPGGQHQNTTDSAVTVIHRPTGTSVHIEGRSQTENRRKARSELARRLDRRAEADTLRIRNAQRREQITSGERPVKQFTHNTQRNEVVDHETGRKWTLDRWMKGRW
jgi:peptide chain release factor 1